MFWLLGIWKKRVPKSLKEATKNWRKEERAKIGDWWSHVTLTAVLCGLHSSWVFMKPPMKPAPLQLPQSICRFPLHNQQTVPALKRPLKWSTEFNPSPWHCEHATAPFPSHVWHRRVILSLLLDPWSALFPVALSSLAIFLLLVDDDDDDSLHCPGLPVLSAPAPPSKPTTTIAGLVVLPAHVTPLGAVSEGRNVELDVKEEEVQDNRVVDARHAIAIATVPRVFSSVALWRFSSSSSSTHIPFPLQPQIEEPKKIGTCRPLHLSLIHIQGPN